MFRNITVEDGLSNNFVTAINQDTRGYLWFGTLDGLDRYDGLEIRSYAHKFPSRPVKVNCIINDPNQGIWIGSDLGLFYWDFITEMFQEVKLMNESFPITTLLFLPGDSLLLTGTPKGIWLLNVFSNESTPIFVQEINNEEIQITNAQISGADIWVTTTNGLIRITLPEFKVKSFINNNSISAFNNFSSLAVHGDTIFLGTQTRGLFIFEPSKQTFSTFTDIGNQSIHVVKHDSKGYLYIGTDGGGLTIMDLKDYSFHAHREIPGFPHSLNSNAVYSMNIDRHGRLWLGTYSGGVNYNTTHEGGFQVSVFEKDLFLGQSSIRSMYFDDNNDKYIGTRLGLYISKNSGETLFFNKDNSPLESNVILTLKKHKDHILIGTFRGGATKLNNKTNELVPFEDEVLSATGSVYGFEHDSEGNLLIATMEGLYVKDIQTNEIHYFNTTNSDLKDSRLISILNDSNNRLWLGSINSGTSVFKWEDFKLKPVDQNLDLSKYKAVSFFEDSKENIWISSEHEGLIKISPRLHEVSIYSENEGLPNNSVCAITEAPEDVYWITTLKGFSRYDIKTDSFRNYTLSHGLPGLVFNRGAIVNDYVTDDRVWLGAENGLASFNPDIIEKHKPIEKVTITDVYLDGKSLSPSILNRPIEQVSNIILKGTQSGLGFRFIAMNYFNPNDNQYNYRLLEREKEWQPSTGNFAHYSNLKPGKYTFQVSLSEEPGTITAINILIKPLWYQHALFKILIVILIFVIIAVTFKIVNDLKRKVHQVQEEKDPAKENQKKYETSHLNAARSKEIEILLKSHVEASKIYLDPDLKLQGLAAAINCTPHDVSQVLNQNLNQSYYEFINRYRIEAVKERMADSTYKKYTLLAIAQECGYNSKTSFYRAFKKLTGLTPVQYQKQFSQTPSE